MDTESLKNTRIIILTVFIFAIFLVFALRLFQFQIVDGEIYANDAKKTYILESSVAAVRGEIKDRNGKPIVENKLGYAIIFDRAYMPEGKENEIILELSKLMNKYDEKWERNIPIIMKKGTEESENEVKFDFMTDKEASISKMKSVLRLQNYATIENCINAMITRYELEKYSAEEAFEIGSIRYEMESKDFSRANQFTFAKNVSAKTMAIIKENNASYPGVNIKSQANREYVDTKLAPFIIGEVGPIFAEEYQFLKEQGYKMNDTVGISGIEKAMESYLKGKDGTRSIILNEYGEIEYEKIKKKPQPGNTVYLTMDIDLQKKAQEILETNIKRLQSQGGKGWDCNAGAFVIMDVNSGDVLASATYPTYDMDEYHDKYEELIKDEDSPLLDRAFNGIYAPGSCMKPSVALAALQDETINDSEYITCTHTYNYFDDMSPTCMGHHGGLNVYEALKVSCNIFFFETGRRETIERMNYYAKQLGLGQSTGVEIPEHTGILAGREYAEAQGLLWTGGQTITAAIGQSYNLFTPAQLANYAAVIANGGTRYRMRLVEEVKSYDEKEVIKSSSPEVLNKLQVSENNIKIVQQGMYDVTQIGGTAGQILAGYRMDSAAKTGTAEAGKIGSSDNSIFIGYAPLEKPEIALGIVLEHGESSLLRSASVMAKETYDYYFYGENPKADDASSGEKGVPSSTNPAN